MKYYQRLVNFTKSNYLDIATYTSIFFIILYDKFNKFSYGGFSDSPSYIKNSILVSPLYPMIVDIFQFIFGQNNLPAICIVQFMLTYTILFFACRKLLNIINLPAELKVFLTFIIALIFSGVCVDIQTESFAYPLFFVFLSFLMETILRRTTKDFIIAMFVLTFLYLIRSQFSFLVPLMFLLLLVFTYTDKAKWLKLKIYGSFAVCLLIGALFPPTANYFIHGKFIGPQGGGLVFSASPSYFARAEDKDLFPAGFNRDYFLAYVDKLQEVNAIKYCDESKWKKPDIKKCMEISKPFNTWTPKSYERWCNGILKRYDESKEGKYAISNINGHCEVTDGEHGVNSTDLFTSYSALATFDKFHINDWTVINPILADIGMKLRIKHFSEWIKLYFNMLFSNFGGYFMIALYLIVAFAVYLSSKRKGSVLDSPADIFMLLTLLFHLSLVSFISFVAMAHDRYFIYTYAMIFCSFILALDNFRMYIAEKFAKK